MRPFLPSFLSELEKIALSRAAKELIKGRLNPQTLARIRSTMRPSEVMSTGLARGSENIAKRLGVPVYEGGVREALKETPGVLKKLIKKENIPEGTLRQMATPFAAMAGGGGITVSKDVGSKLQGIYLQPSQTLIRGVAAREKGGRIAALKELAGKGMNPQERRHLSEVIKRHEVDEARAMARKSSYMNRTGMPWTPGWKDIPLTGGGLKQGGGMHADPRVLMEESRNLTFAPERVQEAMRTLRKMTGEQAGMLERAGVEIGKRTPVAGSRAARGAERRLLDVPTPTIVSQSGPIHMTPEFQQKIEAGVEKGKQLVGRAKKLFGR